MKSEKMKVEIKIVAKLFDDPKFVSVSAKMPHQEVVENSLRSWRSRGK